VVYRRGELGKATIDRDGPHQVALPTYRCTGGNDLTVRLFREGLSLFDRGHSFYRDGIDMNVFCFAERAHAEQFRQHFGGTLTGRGHPWIRGLVCGAMTALGGIGHTLPFLISDFRVAMTAAIAVVIAELAAITWVRHRYMETPPLSAALQVGLGGALVFLTGILIGSS